jgi:hypothetical protein
VAAVSAFPALPSALQATQQFSPSLAVPGKKKVTRVRLRINNVFFWVKVYTQHVWHHVCGTAVLILAN